MPHRLGSLVFGFVPARTGKRGDRVELSQKRMRKQLERMKPLITGCSMELARKGQDALGALLSRSYHKEVRVEEVCFPGFPACRIVPRDQSPVGRMLYLHGGGYVCGDLEYAKGFGSVLSAVTGAEVLCPAYRLAPEHPFPAGLEDSFSAYQFLLEQEGPVVLCGESAGGGMIYALCFLAKEKGLPLPAGLIGISPWTDLTASGSSYEENRERDPSMTRERLDLFASCYTECRDNPLVSPLFGDLTGFPPSLLFVGGDEIMLDDSRRLHEKLLSCGCASTLEIAPELWHAYVLYCLKERRTDLDRIAAFCHSCFCGENNFQIPRKM